MATGFTQRWLSKIKAATLYIGNGGIVLQNGNVLNQAALGSLYGLGAAATTEAASIPAYGITALSTSSGTWTLGTPVAGYEKLIQADGASTGGLRKVFSGSTLITFDGTNDVITSSAAGVIALYALSTTRWLITGNTGGATLGTST